MKHLISFLKSKVSKSILKFAIINNKNYKKMAIYNFLAFDLGATSGRSVIGTLRDGRIETRELTRFPNGIVELHGKFYWNLMGLYEHLKEGLAACAREGVTPDSIGIDTVTIDLAVLKLNFGFTLEANIAKLLCIITSILIYAGVARKV